MMGGMSATAYGRWGRQCTDPSPAQITELLAELDAEDDEHPDASIVHESAWALSAFPSGLLVWEDTEAGAEERPRHMREVPRAVMEELFRAVAADDLDAVRAQAWLPGYG